MSTHTDLHDEFARGINTLGHDSAKKVADHFAELTCLHENNPSHFMYHENSTWRLLSVLAETKTKSSLHRLAALKQWVSQIDLDQDLIDRIDEFNDVDEEITHLFHHVGLIRSKDLQEPPRKKRIVTTNEQDDENVYKQHFEKLRSNDLRPIQTSNQNVLIDYMVNGFMQYQKMALMDEGSEIINRERSAWKKAVMHGLKQTSRGKYRNVLFNVLAGKSEELYTTTACNTWEDVIWAYFNEKTEAMLDTPHATLNRDNMLPNHIATIASSKDAIMDKDDPRILFHKIQMAILSNQQQQIIKDMCLIFSDKDRKGSFHISEQPEERAEILRFLSTLILYGREYCEWQESSYSTQLLSAYADMNAEPSVMKPAVIAAYAAKQSTDQQMKVYSTFLQNFDGDDQECAIILQLGKEYSFDMPNILLSTYTRLFKKAMASAPNKVSAKAPDDKLSLSLEGVITTDDAVFLQAIKWLTLDESMCVQAFQAANMTIRYLLGIYKIYLISEIFELYTDVMIENMTLKAKQDVDSETIFSEFILHRHLVDSLVKYDSWEKLSQNEPKDDGSYYSIVDVYQWQDQVREETTKIGNRMFQVLHGNWLAKDADDETAHISNATLRQIYIPELLIRYHHVLYSTITIMPSNKKKCKQLSQLIMENDERVFNDVTLAKKMGKVVKELSKSLE